MIQSSDESDSESDRQHNDEDDTGRRNPGHEIRLSVSQQQEATALKPDAPNYTEELGNIPNEHSPSEFVVERLRKRRSARASSATPSKEDQYRPEWLTTDGYEDDVEISPAKSTKHQAPAVEDVSTQPSKQKSDGDMAYAFCNSPLINDYPPITRPPDATATLKAPTIARDSDIEADSSLGISDLNSPSKRTTFNEFVEVRTSPTYWQREHSEGDGPYAQFSHEHYHEELRSGQKAVPLKDPLKDPDGQSARQLHLPPYGIDEESFNSWSAPGAGWDAFTAPSFGYNSSTNSSSGSQPHPSTLYIPKGYNTNDDPGLYDQSSGFDKTRPNPSNRQHQSYNGNDFPCGQGKENQPYPTSPNAPKGPSPPFSFFDDRCRPAKAHRPKWSPRDDSPYPSRANSSWCPGGPLSNCGSRSVQEDKHSGFYEDIEFDPKFLSKDQEAIADDQDFHQGTSHSDFGHGEYLRPRHSRTSDGEQTCSNTEPFNTHEDFKKSRPRFPRTFPGHSAERASAIERDIPYDTDIPFDYSNTTTDTFREPKLPPVGFAMEIPDDMSDSDVHNLLIPGYDNYVP
ncbi:uncharacterized protein ColSpa_00303 [Colletotrichum spaethianum]|uniref:Uncharacterized protein n=1 Tax=Colletotrichum spaethianum TaxID=700344 RepID=A0AA37L969_9PEZI|nr:uncharacterized protein ColSpa_00303 [Colletotrichum spaethianum]GKT40122.1 hypothetical protein ColSpa_00303 [Colletotrichum spaethianum]